MNTSKNTELSSTTSRLQKPLFELYLSFKFYENPSTGLKVTALSRIPRWRPTRSWVFTHVTYKYNVE